MAYPLSFAGLVADSAATDRPFERRILHPWMDRRPVLLPEPDRVYPELLKSATGERLAYVHIPFCSNHCLFCGFYRYKADDVALSAYADHVVADIEREAEREGGVGRAVSAIYLGGGTPSALSARDLHRILKALHRLPLTRDCEITVEGRVAGFDDERIEACLDAGANRFSIGIQSFDTTLRHRMGRRASQKEAVDFLRRLVARDRAAVVCDLIFGLPGQTDEVWQRDVALCRDIGLDGVDLYCLTLQSGSPLAQAIGKGALPPPADDLTAERRYIEGGADLEAAGWVRLSQAHWGRTARERNRYNSATKGGADCLAFGAGAGGALAGHRFMLEGDVTAYQERVARGEKPVAGLLAPPRHKTARDLVMSGLEDGAIDLRKLDAVVEAGFSSALAPLLERWSAQALVQNNDTTLRLTPKGRYWHNNLAGVLFGLISAYVDGPQSTPAGPPPGIGHPGGHPGRHPGAGHPPITPRNEHPHEHHGH